MTYIPARPTTYRGISMRSRLEAKFAADLDATVGVEWLYEPRAYANERGQYLPDFQVLQVDHLPVLNPWFLEVRPTLDRAYLAMDQMTIIWDSEPEAWLWIFVPGEVTFIAKPKDRKWAIV